MPKSTPPREEASDALERYRRKRNFANTPEPPGRTPGPAADRLQFVVQKHAARRLHYDFRLEHAGVLKSWAVPRGPSLAPSERRLAVQTEDHPLEYAAFEGIIPRGEYGGGTVLVWDRGYWEPESAAERGLARGRLDFVLHGDKLRGRWTLVRMPKRRGERGGKDNWLLIKRRDGAAASAETPELVEVRPESVLSGRDIEAVAAAGDRVWHSNRGAHEPEGVPGARRAAAPATLDPAVPRHAADVPSGPGWLHEPRLEGRRAWCRVAEGRALFWRAGDRRETLELPELAAAALALPCTEALVDGVVTVFDERGISDAGRLTAAAHSGEVRFVAFDLLRLDGWDLRGAALPARKQLLRLLLTGAPPALRYGDHVEGHGPAFFAEGCRAGLTGVVSKRADSAYGAENAWLESRCSRR